MNIQTVPAPRNLYFSPQECQNYYGKPYNIREIQIHWWDSPAAKPSHEGVVAYGLRRAEGSANYIASAGKVTKMVEENMCALTTQGGNPHGIKIECSPYGTDGDYATIAELVADIWKRRGYLPLVPHKKYWNTTCPGSLDLGRIEREAQQLIGGKGGAGGDEVMNENGAKGLYRLGLHREPENDQVWRGWLGKPADQGMEAFRGSPEWLSQNHVLLVAYPQAQEAIRQLQEQLKTASEKPPEVVIKEVEKIVEKCDLPDVVKPEPIEPKKPNWLARLLAALSRKK